MWLRRLWRVIRRSAFRRSQDDREIEEELRFHLAQEIQLRIDRGAAPAAAERSTHLALRSLTLVKEDTRAVWVATWLEQTWQDVRTGCRIVTTAPLLTVTAVALVALVIGGNTTVFSMAHAILHGPAPGVRASNLVTLSWSRADGGFDPGVHMALGASSAQVMGAVFRDGLRLTLVGLAIGLGLSIAVGHAMRGLLYGVTPTDAVTYAGVLALLAGCSLLACLLPAYQAARLDPVRVLRFE